MVRVSSEVAGLLRKMGTTAVEARVIEMAMAIESLGRAVPGD